MSFLELPDELIRTVFSYLTFDEACRHRVVCSTFDAFIKQYLNDGFRRVEQRHAQCWQLVKSQLPRRESERRTHRLARHNDILTAVETRLSLLGMTYNKFIELRVCCFIPGRVLDEARTVIGVVARALSSADQPPRPHELLQELRDISSMAMEHFDERIAAGLRDSLVAKAAGGGRRVDATLALLGAAQPAAVLPPPPTRSALPSQLAELRRGVGTCRASVGRIETRLRDQTRKLADQARLVQLQSRKLDEFARKFAELNRVVLQQEATIADLRSQVTSGVPTTSGRKRACEPTAVASTAKRAKVDVFEPRRLRSHDKSAP